MTSLSSPPTSPPLPVEEWKARRGTLDWAYRAAYVAQHWCQGLLLDEYDYDAAIEAALHGEIR